MGIHDDFLKEPYATLERVDPVPKGAIGLAFAGGAMFDAPTGEVEIVVDPLTRLQKTFRIHPEIERPWDAKSIMEAASRLREGALRWPTTRWNVWWRIFWLSYKWKRWGRNLNKLPRFYTDCTAFVGFGEYEIILSRRKHMDPKWHLSVIPHRFGRLYPWEVGVIEEAFGVHFPRMEQDGPRTHWYWNDEE